MNTVWLPLNRPRISSLGRSPYNWHRFSKYCYVFGESDEFNVFQFLEFLLSSSSHSSLSCRNFFLRVIFSFFSSPMTFFFSFFFFFIIISTNCETLPVGIREHGRKDSWPCLLSVGISAGRGKEQDATGAETFRMAIVLRLAQDRSCTLKLRITRGPKVDHFLGWFTSSNLGPLELLAQQDRAEWTTRWGRNASSRRQFDYRTWHALCTSFFPLFSPVFPFSFRPLPTS